MSNKFAEVKHMLTDLGYLISRDDEAEGLMVVDDPDEGIRNLIIVIDSPLIIFEQFLVNIADPDAAVFRQILERNRDLVHGAFALAGDNDKLLFRDTLQVDNLDNNELEGTLNAVTIMMAEHGAFLQSIA